VFVVVFDIADWWEQGCPMRLPWFLLAAIALIVFAIIAMAGSTAAAAPWSALLFGVTAAVWLAAAVLAYLVHVLLAATWAVYGDYRRQAPAPRTAPPAG
jgi:hypothetical protein